ncbi:MAG: methylenetetrahydrofolate dehydrogenase (NADP+) / methenyltetrahydrofolate cyclohydrolase, partial [Parcubacteria group bacterium Gr01-1014_70]
LAELDKKVVVAVGQGMVIGKQVNRWAIRKGAMELHSLREGSNVERYIRKADIIVLGVGKAGLITSEMVNGSAVVFDFGYSRENGKVRGDADPAVAHVARLLTPVPGGLGPLAVTMLFWNVARIAGVKLKN